MRSRKGKKNHGRRRTSLYSRWSAMIQRCHNQNDRWYHRYGARGIVVCERWRNDFLDFARDVGEPPSAEHSLDRFPDNDGNYEPGNVRWATRLEQSLNKCNTKYCTMNGVKRPLLEWCKILGLNYYTIRSRINLLHWSDEKALKTPVKS